MARRRLGAVIAIVGGFLAAASISAFLAGTPIAIIGVAPAGLTMLVGIYQARRTDI
jgi:type IV secretory pathway VirB2 component (pilin)